MNKCKQQKIEEEQLNNQFKEANLTCQDNPTQETLLALNVLKEKMEQIYEKKSGRHNRQITSKVA